jgi:hypothetical protein
MAEGVFARGVALATQSFTTERNPSAALDILFKLARRQSDFGQYTAIILGWGALGTKQREWLWTKDSQYWEYLDLVATAYRACGQPESADQLANTFLNDPSTPPNGLVTVGIPHALSLLQRSSREEAFSWLDWLAGQAPTHVLCAYAYYWQALRAWHRNDTAAVKVALDALHLCLGSSFTLGWMNDLDARSRMLEGVSSEQLASQSAYTAEYLLQQWQSMEQDRAQL